MTAAIVGERGPEIDITLITGKTPKVELEQAMAVINGKAKDTHPSPEYDNLHAMLNLLLTYWQAAGA